MRIMMAGAKDVEPYEAEIQWGLRRLGFEGFFCSDDSKLSDFRPVDTPIQNWVQEVNKTLGLSLSGNVSMQEFGQAIQKQWDDYDRALMDD